MKRELEFDSLLAPSEVARLFGVDSKTVTRWARAGRLGSVRTPSGHRRYRESEVRVLLGAKGLDGTGTLTPSEVARMFSVDPATVTRWAKAGRLSSVRTPGGHRRYWESEVRGLLATPGPGCRDGSEEQAA